MFYPLSGQENCFSLAALGLKQLFSFPTIGKNKFLPLVFPCLAKFFHMTGTYIPYLTHWKYFSSKAVYYFPYLVIASIFLIFKKMHELKI